MLESRLYKPNQGTKIYHYCSAETLQAICSSKSIRMSDINMMNDYRECQYGYAVFEEAATEILKDPAVASTFPDFNVDFFDKVDEVISSFQRFLHPVIASFSKNPDVLSQWYRYGNGGQGFAVGLDVEILQKMPISILEVEYDRAVQVKETRAALAGIFMRNKTENLNYNSTFKNDCALLGAMLLSFKSKAFVEEEEVRLLHLLDVVDRGNTPYLQDKGGMFNGRNVKGQPVRYRVSDGAYIAYIDSPFPVINKHSIIKEIWFGPKNTNAVGNLKYMASEHGWKEFEVFVSEATFR